MEKRNAGRPFVVDWKHSEQELLEAWKKSEKKDSNRFHALYLLRKGEKLGNVKNTLAIHYKTVIRWVRLYREKGLDGIKKKKTGPRSGTTGLLNDEQKSEILNRSDDGKIISAPQEARELKNRYNIIISYSGMRKLLRRLDLRPKMPRPKNPKRDEEKFKQWKEGGLTKALWQNGANPTAGTIVVADEARIGLIGTVRRRWLRKGIRFEQDRQYVYKWAWLLIAIDILTGNIFWEWQENMKKESFANSLKKLKSKGVGTIIWDRARGHCSKEAKEAGPTLVFQPASTPESNPAERFIQVLRQAIEGFVYETLDDKKKMVEKFLEELKADPARVKRLCSWDWIVGSVRAAHPELAA
jgi:transposase